jgi:hypothetical protein
MPLRVMDPSRLWKMTGVHEVTAGGRLVVELERRILLCRRVPECCSVNIAYHCIGTTCVRYTVHYNLTSL